MSKDLKESEYDPSKVTEHGVPLYIHERLCKQARDTAATYAANPENQLNMVGRSIWFYDENYESPHETRINDINDLTQKEADEFIRNVNKYFEKFLSQNTKEEIPHYIVNNLSEVAKKRTFDSKDKPVYRSVLTNDTSSLFLWDSAGHPNATYYYHQLSLEKADEFIEKVNSYFENLDDKKEIVQEEKIQEEEDKKLSLTEKTNGVPNYLWFKLSDEAKKHFKLDSENLKSGRWQTTVAKNLISVHEHNGLQLKNYSLVNATKEHLDIAAKEINNYYKLVSQLENKFSAELYRALDENKINYAISVNFNDEAVIQFKMNDVSFTISSSAEESGIEHFVESVNYISKKLYEPAQFNAYADFELKTTTKVSQTDMEQSVPLWDYYHDKPVFQSYHGISQGDREFPIKPFVRFGKKVYHVDVSEKTKHEWYSKITQKVKIDTASGEKEVPAFIKEIIGNKKVYLYCDRQTTHGALKSEQDTFFIISISRPNMVNIIEISPKIYSKYYEKMSKSYDNQKHFDEAGLSANFWNHKEYFADEIEPKITHIAFVLNDSKKEIEYEFIKINGEEKSLQAAFQIRSDFIKKTISKVEAVYDKNLSKQENKEEKIEDSAAVVAAAATNTNTNKLKEIIVSDSVEVYKRISVSRISKLVQDILIQIISAAAPKNKKQVHSQLESFFKSEKGKALIQLVSGASLPFVLSHIPEKYREYISVASDELRIQGETQIALEIIDSFSGFMKNKIIEDLVSSGEFIRVDVGSVKENNLDSEEIESQQLGSTLLQGAL